MEKVHTPKRVAAQPGRRRKIADDTLMVNLPVDIDPCTALLSQTDKRHIIPAVGRQSLRPDHFLFAVCQQEFHFKPLCRRVRKTKPATVFADQTEFPDPVRNAVGLEPR